MPNHSKNRLASFTPAGFLLHFQIFLFPLKIEEEADIQHDAHSGRGGRGQTDHGQAGVRLDAHDVSHGQADQEGLHKALHHDPDGLVVAVEVAHHAEQHRCDDRLRRKTAQIGEGIHNDGGVCSEDAGQQIALEPHQRKHRTAEDQTDGNAGEQSLPGPLFVAGADILRDERGHRLHQRAGDEHGEVDDLAGHAVAGGRFQTQTVDEGAERQKGNLRQKLLQSQRQANVQELAALEVETEISLFELERQMFPP